MKSKGRHIGMFHLLFFGLGLIAAGALFAAPVSDQAVTRDDEIAGIDGGAAGKDGKPIKVFFLGNSYTAAAGSQPSLVKEMLVARGYAPVVESYIQAGETLEGFWLRNEGNEPVWWERKQMASKDEVAKEKHLKKIAAERTLKRIGKLDEALKKNVWDVVVIQVWQGAKQPEEMEFQKYASLLVGKVRQGSPDARIVLYEVWGSQNRPEEQNIIRASCDEAVLKNGLVLAPAGTAAWNVLKKDPSVILHRSPKDSHPGRYGAYLAACSIFAAITDRSPVGLPSRMMLPPNYDFPYTVGSEESKTNKGALEKGKLYEWSMDVALAERLQRHAWAAYQQAAMRSKQNQE